MPLLLGERGPARAAAHGDDLPELRALAPQLLDEPLSNLDANLREKMRFEIRRLHESFGITTLYMTHDQGEAMVISDRRGPVSPSADALRRRVHRQDQSRGRCCRGAGRRPSGRSATSSGVGGCRARDVA